MNTRSVILKFAAVSALAAAVLSPAWATLPLASFSQTSPNATPFFYNSNGNIGISNATFNSTATVNFTYLGTGRAGQTFNNVTMSIINSAVTGAPSAAVGESVQPVDFSILFTTNMVQNGVGAGQTLLRMDATGVFEGGFLGGIIGTTSIGVQGSDQGPPTPMVNYSSTVVTGLMNNPAGYPGTSARDYSLSLTSLTTPLMLDADAQDFANFNASISGVFGFSPNVPEPGTVAMLIGLGCSSSLLAVRRLRRR